MQNKEAQREQMMLMIADWQGSGLNQREYCIANKMLPCISLLVSGAPIQTNNRY